MRLHNRQIKAAFWNDPDLLQWPRDKRWFYFGLVQLADDSGCLEDSPFAFKIQLFPSPVDADITTDVIEKWCDELVEAGKLVRYEAAGKPCLYIKNFHKHQTLKNCLPPDVPLPPWITWEPFKSNDRSGKYIINKDILTEFLQGSYAGLTNDLQPSSNQNQNQNLTRTATEQKPERGLGETQRPPSPSAPASMSDSPDSVEEDKDQGSQGEDSKGDVCKQEGEDCLPASPAVEKSKKEEDQLKRRASAIKHEYPAQFEHFWAIYPRHINKVQAFKCWRARMREGITADDLIHAAQNYAEYCRRKGLIQDYIMYPSTFLGPNRRWEDYIRAPTEEVQVPRLAANVRRGLELVAKFERQESGAYDPG